MEPGISTESVAKVEGLLQRNAESIVQDDLAVSVSHVIESGQVKFTVKCAPADARFIIGKAGANAQGLKALARAAGQKLGIKVETHIDVPPMPGQVANTQ
mgnify:CR=1 FL=1